MMYFLLVVIGATGALSPTASSEMRRSLQRLEGGGGGVGHELEFSHVEVFVRSLRPLSEYNKLEAAMERFSDALNREKLKLDWYSDSECAAAAALFDSRDEVSSFDETDLVAQLICGLNWRMVSSSEGEDGDRSATIGAPGDKAATFVITSSERSRRFCDSKRPGIGVLGFRCRSIDAVRDAYRSTHPELLVEGCDDDVVEAYAYYDEDGVVADKSSAVLRFVERSVRDEYEHSAARSAVSDHWVSNVKDRDAFVKTLDALGLSPKVEFDAGVISAGAASIESTVVGGDSVYLPVNNALSEAGHVAGFLEQIGQGVQHLASRVDDLVAFVSTARMLRNATGLGFDFLDVPRSYYGRLDSSQIDDGVFNKLVKEGIVDEGGLVDLDADPEIVSRAVGGDAELTNFVLRQRYGKIYDVLGDQLTEEQYVRVVKSRILVDSQGPDALLQIFTKCVLQEDPAHEAPFLEFIQRVCGGSREEETKLGCGGFGIRNFLALFLSIELNSALRQLTQATTKESESKARAKVNSLNSQLDLSSPILQQITQAATEEAEAKTPSDLQSARLKKQAAQTKLQEISQRFAEEAKQYS